jgi:hypothetical protein
MSTKLLKRQTTISVRNQTKNDCLIYSIANVFMRKIVILLKWNTEDASIEWDEVDPNTCDSYAPGRENDNLTKYKYCILYTYIQGIYVRVLVLLVHLHNQQLKRFVKNLIKS